MSKPPFVDVFSLWLMPKESEAQIWQDLVNGLAIETETIPFIPHMTLLALPGQSPRERDNVVLHAERLAQQLQNTRTALTMEFVGIGARDSYVQALFLMGVSTQILVDWFNEACSIFSKVASPGGIYMPHFGLVYGDILTKKKPAIIQKISLQFPLHITFDRLALYDCNGMPPEWHEVESWPLIHR